MDGFPKWLRHRYVWAAAVLLATTIGAVVLVNPAGPKAEPASLQTQITTMMRTSLEQSDPEQHHHSGHASTGTGTNPPVVCGVRVYGYEPADAVALSDVRTVYGFHLCGVAEPGYPWDVATKLAGPVIVDMSAEPPGIQVVEATAEVKFVDRLRQMFPPKYAEPALKEALTPAEMADLRRRYDAAAHPD